MPDTIRTRSELIALLADNQSGNINAQALRDLLASLPLTADLAYTRGAQGSGYRPGYWYSHPLGTLNFQQPIGVANTAPIHFPRSGTITDLAMEVTTAGTTGAVIRLGVYRDKNDGSFSPGELLIDAGTVDATTIGVKTITLPIPVSIAAGCYWPVAVAQGSPSTLAAWRLSAGPVPGIGTTSASVLSQQMSSWSVTGITGALPLTWPGTLPSTNASRVAIKVG